MLAVALLALAVPVFAGEGTAPRDAPMASGPPAVNPLTGATPPAGNPLTGKAAPATPPRSATSVPERWWDEIGRAMRNLQREASRRIARQMAAIAEGKTPGALLVGMALAFLYGVLHTLGPGHGKTVAASYFLANDARFGRGAWMGVKIAITHVIAAVALVWLADVTFRKLMGGAPTEVRVLQQASYAAIAAVGAWMLVRALRRARSGGGPTCAPDHHGSGHGHPHHHDHATPLADESSAKRQQSLLAFAAGLAPCTGALLIMLYALANGIVLAGILLVICISAGMALTIAAIGAFCILARRIALRTMQADSPRRRWLTTGIEVLGALAILALGALLFATVPPAA